MNRLTYNSLFATSHCHKKWQLRDRTELSFYNLRRDQKTLNQRYLWSELKASHSHPAGPILCVLALGIFSSWPSFPQLSALTFVFCYHCPMALGSQWLVEEYILTTPKWEVNVRILEMEQEETKDSWLTWRWKVDFSWYRQPFYLSPPIRTPISETLLNQRLAWIQLWILCSQCIREDCIMQVNFPLVSQLGENFEKWPGYLPQETSRFRLYLLFSLPDSQATSPSPSPPSHQPFQKLFCVHHLPFIELHFLHTFSIKYSIYVLLKEQ